MVIFLSAVFAVALLILIVYALHRYQQKEKAESVDRALPLPPLEFDRKPVIADEYPEDILGLDPSSLPVAEPVKQETAAVTPAGESAHWLTESRALKEAGDFKAALERCQLAYPQAGAFKQACVVLRAMLREARRSGQNPEPLLQSLYRTAALSAYFHARDDELAPLSPAELRRLNRDDWLNIPLPYQDIGVEHIPLLNGSDIKLLREYWGVSHHEIPVRHFHRRAWQELVRKLKINPSNDL